MRVQRITCMMGQVTGTAAGIAVHRNTTARGVGQKHIDQLQQTLLYEGCYLMGVKNEDPKDLALGSKVTASSHGELAGPPKPHGGLIHNLNAPRATMFYSGKGETGCD